MKRETFENTIKTAEYVEGYVNVEEFLGYCRECHNYGHIWACPPHDFDPVKDYWLKYNNLYVLGRKIYFEGEKDEKKCSEFFIGEKNRMAEELYAKEKEIPGSISLFAGSCNLCEEKGCTRTEGKPCRYPALKRYSIEALGGNVGLTADKLLGIELQWMEENKIPEYFVLIGGLLY